MRILCVVGARPNFVKMARLYWALDQQPNLEPYLVHTGQHFSSPLSGSFFNELGLPEPAINFGATNTSPGGRFGYMMQQMDAAITELQPELVLVVGDVDSTLSCALAASRRGIPVAHVEAGLRSGDMAMPEEVNRKLVDHISDLLFCSEEAGVQNLKAEGIPSIDQQVHLVGNTMIDTLKYMKPTVDRLHEHGGDYMVATIHRPRNVDNRQQLSLLLEALAAMSERLQIQVNLPAHPRLQKALDLNFKYRSGGYRGALAVTGPMSYLNFINMLKDAKLVLTDSGGIQEEAAYLGIPCVTMRPNTERPSTLAASNILGGTTPSEIWAAAGTVMGRKTGPECLPSSWDGKASERIAVILNEWACPTE